MTAFRGQFEHTLDDKHRLTIPAKFRSVLAEGVVLAATQETGPDSPRSIAIWRPEDYEAYTQTVLRGENPMSPAAREMKRFFYGYSHDTELDSAHRVMIPPKLMEYAGLDREVLLSGAGDCLEIFDRRTYNAYGPDAVARVPEIAASLGHTS